VPVDLLSVCALLAVLLLGSIRSDLNVGIIATALAFGIGLTLAGLSAAEIAAFLPSSLILTIVGVALFFELSANNGTLSRLTTALVRLTGNNPAQLPIIFFLLTLVLSALGPGNIAATALVAPLAMRAALRAGISPFLMAVLVCTGANTGAFSPVSVTGNINATLMRNIGLDDPNLPLLVFMAVAVIQSLTALVAYVIFSRRLTPIPAQQEPVETAKEQPLEDKHRFTLLFMLAFLLLVLVWQVPASAAAFGLAAVMLLVRLAEGEQAVQNLPWSVIVLIAGISMLIGLLEKTGGLALVTDWLAAVATPNTLNAVLAFTSGLASMGSSSSGVVMPLFIPLAPEIIAKLGAGSLVEAVIAIDAGSHMVDVSPLSTLGALCLAAMPAGQARQQLFKSLLAWGVAMAFVGALLAWVLLDLR
jgi:di/tricarboxylate transporter